VSSIGVKVKINTDHLKRSESFSSASPITNKIMFVSDLD